MFTGIKNWFKSWFEPDRVDWEVINHQDEMRDADYLKDFTGVKNGAKFQNANCHIRFSYGNNKSIHGKCNVFTGGQILEGNYKCSVWGNGEFYGDELSCNSFNGGVFKGKKLICQHVTGGECYGTVECEDWNNGQFNGDVLACDNWYGGTFSGSIFHGRWRGGIWRGKYFKGIDLSNSGLETE